MAGSAGDEAYGGPSRKSGRLLEHVRRHSVYGRPFIVLVVTPPCTSSPDGQTSLVTEPVSSGATKRMEAG